MFRLTAKGKPLENYNPHLEKDIQQLANKRQQMISRYIGKVLDEWTPEPPSALLLFIEDKDGNKTLLNSIKSPSENFIEKCEDYADSKTSGISQFTTPMDVVDGSHASTRKTAKATERLNSQLCLDADAAEVSHVQALEQQASLAIPKSTQHLHLPLHLPQLHQQNQRLKPNPLRLKTHPPQLKQRLHR